MKYAPLPLFIIIYLLNYKVICLKLANFKLWPYIVLIACGQRLSKLVFTP